MKYYKCETYDSDLGQGMYFFEIEEDGYMSRQIEVGELGILTSSNDTNWLEGKFTAEEGSDISIEKEEFEKTWKEALQLHEEAWLKVKNNIKIGDQLKGDSVVFGRPKGRVLFDVGKDFFATGDFDYYYNFISKWTDAKAVPLTVTGFNDLFQWIEVKY